jgi:diaminopimelate decarboxylase
MSELYIDDMPAHSIAQKFGTPLYCYSATGIENNFSNWQAAFEKTLPPAGFTICFACKANDNIAIMSLLGKQGAGADIVSGGELARAIKAKIPPRKIVYSGVGKKERELAEALRLGILQINVESEEELRLISKLAKKMKKTVQVALRVNPDVDAKTHAKITTGKKENKFGINIKDAPRLYRLAKSLPGIKATGVAVHIGSQITSLAPFKKAYKRVAGLVLLLRKEGNTITTVDLGGGMGITYKDETPPDLHLYALMVANIFSPLDVHVILEPGRALVGNAGVLLSSVVSVKKGHDKTFVILDAGMNDLIRPALYAAYHEIIPVRPGTGKKQSYDIVGPVCETGDAFHTSKKMPPLKTGDVVAILSAGAYGAVMSSSYNTRPPAGEVMVKGSRAALIRKAKTVEEIIAEDTVPGWLK